MGPIPFQIAHELRQRIRVLDVLTVSRLYSGYGLIDQSMPQEGE